MKVPGSASLLGPSLLGHHLWPHQTRKEAGPLHLPAPLMRRRAAVPAGWCGRPPLGLLRLWPFGICAVPLVQASTCHPAVGSQDPVTAGVGGDPSPDGEKGREGAIWALTMGMAPGEATIEVDLGVPTGSSLEPKGVVPEWPRLGVWASPWGPVASCTSPYTVRLLLGGKGPRIVWPRGSLLETCVRSAGGWAHAERGLHPSLGEPELQYLLPGISIFIKVPGAVCSLWSLSGVSRPRMVLPFP